METDLVKVGEISSIDPANGTARVIFNDDGVVSYDLQVLQTNTGANKDYAMPDVGTNVVCVFLGSDSEDGFVLGSVYTEGNAPPESSGDVRAIKFSDGTTIRYDRAGHVLDIALGGTTVTVSTSDVTIRTSKLVVDGTIECTGDVTAGGISLMSHTHDCPNGGTTSGPN